jgi:hypothetical protein
MSTLTGTKETITDALAKQTAVLAYGGWRTVAARMCALLRFLFGHECTLHPSYMRGCFAGAQPNLSVDGIPVQNSRRAEQQSGWSALLSCQRMSCASRKSQTIWEDGACAYSRYRTVWLEKLTQAGVRRRAERLYQQLDALRPLRQEARHVYQVHLVDLSDGVQPDQLSADELHRLLDWIPSMH